MTPLFSYFFQASLVTAAFQLFYKLLLRRDTFFKWSRSYFVFAVISSFALPFIDVSSLFQNSTPKVLIEYIPNLSFADLQTSRQTDYWQLFLSSLLYAGIAVMFIRLMIQMLALKKLRRNKAITQKENIKIVLLNEQVNPFSFFNEIYINPSLHSDQELEEIIKHEQFHVEQNHTLDILLGEFLTIVFWFNPFAWLLKNEMKQNLEFLTDKLVLQSGIDAKHYQYNLLKVSGLQNNIAAANHFHFLKLKNRIIMMNKKQTNPYHAIKYLLLVPVVTLLLMAFSERKQIIQTFNQAVLHDTMPPPPPPPPPIESKVTVANAPSSVDKITITTSATPNSDSKLPKNVKQVEIVRKDSKKQVTVTLRDGTKEVYDLNKEEDQVNFEKKYGKIAEVIPLPPAPPPANAVAPVEVIATVDPVSPAPPVSSVDVANNEGTGTYTIKKPAQLNEKGYYLSVADNDGECVVIVKNKDKKIVEAVKLTDWDKAKAVYEKKYGIIPPATPKATTVAPTTNASKNGPGNPYTSADITFKTTQAQVFSDKVPSQFTNALVIVDGIKQNKGVVFNLNSIDPNTIASISIFKDKAAIAAYGEEGKDGVILIKTKKKEPTTTITGTIADGTVVKTTTADPLYIVDGKIRTKEEINTIQPENIESVSVLKAEQAIAKYGEQGKNGVVIIVLKK